MQVETEKYFNNPRLCQENSSGMYLYAIFHGFVEFRDNPNYSGIYAMIETLEGFIEYVDPEYIWFGGDSMKRIQMMKKRYKLT